MEPISSIKQVTGQAIYEKTIEIFEEVYTDCWIDGDNRLFIKENIVNDLPQKRIGDNRKIYILNPLLKHTFDTYKTVIEYIYWKSLNDMVLSKITLNEIKNNL